MVSRLNLGRVGAVVACAAVTLTLSALPASADPAMGRVKGGGVDGYRLNLGGSRDGLSTSLIGFELSDGTKLKVYCVEIDTSIDREDDMVEVPFDKYPNPQSPFRKNHSKINWVLHHGYPVTGLKSLETKLGGALHDGLSEKEAVTATQAAAWHFSDEVNLTKANQILGADEGTAADVLALYGYLTGRDNVGMGTAPTPTLEITPGTASGKAGDRIGPFTVATSGKVVELTKNAPAGVKLVDKNGAEIAAGDIGNGTEIYFQVPKGAKKGEAELGLKASAQVATGRLFVGKHYAPDNRTQSLIVATSDRSTLSASAKASWTAGSVTPPTSSTTTVPETTTAPPVTSTPAPQARNTGGLASTGASILVPVVLGLVLVGAGAGALLLQRRRRRA